MKIQNLELLARTVVEGFVQGLHKSPYLGFSVDFAEYRRYIPGDDIRSIDWNVFARSDKLYIKQFEGETNTRVHVLIDVSGSMGYGSGTIKKIHYASFLGACLSYFAFRQRDGVGLLTFDREVRTHLPASRRPTQLHAILKTIDNIVPSNETEFRRPLDYLAEFVKRRGMIVLISDLYDEPENILRGLKHMRSKGNDVVVFHVLDDFELRFPFEQTSEFLDMETGKKLHIIPEYLRRDYLQLINQHVDQMKKDLAAARIDYVVMNTSKPLDQGLFAYLAKRSTSKY